MGNVDIETDKCPQYVGEPKGPIPPILYMGGVCVCARTCACVQFSTYYLWVA